jgi:predicted HAD superfamily Cof-like phosphohydrolase
MYPMQYLTNALKVRRFMEAFGQEVKDKPEWPDDDTVNLRVDLIDEEFNELKQAVYEWGGNLEGVTDALCDILYVTYGMAHSFGIDIDECFREVHVSNMSKLGEDGKPIYREDGKVMKGPNYKPPNLKQYVGDE